MITCKKQKKRKLSHWFGKTYSAAPLPDNCINMYLIICDIDAKYLDRHLPQMKTNLIKKSKNCQSIGFQNNEKGTNTVERF